MSKADKSIVQAPEIGDVSFNDHDGTVTVVIKGKTKRLKLRAAMSLHQQLGRCIHGAVTPYREFIAARKAGDHD